MNEKQIGVTGIGNAIIDIIAAVDDEFLGEFNLKKGSMKLICEQEASALQSRINVRKIISGGSIANTIAGLAILGNRVAFIGKVKNDELGVVFEEELKKLGIIYKTKKAAGKHPPTACCIVLTTPDAQRTMNTFLGVAGLLFPDDINTEMIAQSEIVYIEGYLFYQDQSKKAVEKAVSAGRLKKSKIALSLSDVFCVENNRSQFHEMIDGGVDIIFANESEIISLFETENIRQAIQCCKTLGNVVAVTRGENGSVVISDGKVQEIEAEKVITLDSTGAGDMYAAGFLNGFLKGKDAYTCGRMGSILAAHVVSQYGARYERPLLEILAEKGL